MATTPTERGATAAHSTNGTTGSTGAIGTTGTAHRPAERRSTETKASFKTTEFFAYLAVLAGILIAGFMVDGDGAGADGGFAPSEVWQLATFLTIGYMISRGLAKAGSRDPYTHDNH